MISKNQTTEDHLLEITETISTTINLRKSCMNIFLDIKKAFHSILLRMLEGIREYL